MNIVKADSGKKKLKINSTAGKIPKNIHLVFFDKNAEWPVVFSKCNVQLKKTHPKWHIKLYDAENAIDIISEHLPELLPVYNSYPHYIQRADLFRVILVYLFGGFYLDLDMFCEKSLDELIEYDIVLPEERSVSGKGKEMLAKADGISVKYNFRLGNYMFGGTAGHPFWLYYLKEAIKVAGREIKHEGDILATTGPALLTNVYHKYRKLFPGLVVLKNKDKICTTPFHREICCHFGNFAAHLHQGTWRWMKYSKKPELKNTIDDSLLKRSQRSVDSMIRKILTETVYLTDLPWAAKSSLLARKLHEHLSHSTLPSSKINKISRNKIIVIDIDSLHQEDLRTNNEYLIIITDDIATVSVQTVILINKYASRCIVFNKRVKDILQMHNVKVNILVKDLFYLPLKRDFSEESIVMEDFSIGVFSDLSKGDQEWIELIRNGLADKLKKYRLRIFHDHKTPGRAPKGVNYVSMNSKNISEQFNNLSVFVNFKDNSDNILLLKTALYLGIPCIASKGMYASNNHLVKFFFVCDETEGSRIQLANAIQTLEKNYLKYNRKALLASKYMEDRFSVERKGFEILKAISEK